MQTRKTIAVFAFIFILLLLMFLGLALFAFIPFDEVREGTKTTERIIVITLCAICLIIQGFLFRFLFGTNDVRKRDENTRKN